MNTEAWVGSYPVDFVELQKNFPRMAPHNLASLGYEGLTSMYISSDQPLALLSVPGRLKSGVA